MNFRQPRTFPIFPDTFVYLTSKLDLPPYMATDSVEAWAYQSIEEWAYQTVNVLMHIDTPKIMQCIEVYQEVSELGTFGDMVKCVLVQLLLACVTGQDIAENTYLYQNVSRILEADYHLHEGTVYSYATVDRQDTDPQFALNQVLRNYFQYRYLTSIYYTFETPKNYSKYYDSYKIVCFENEEGSYGYIEIHNTRKEDIHTHYFELPQAQWRRIIAQTLTIGKPVMIRRYDSASEKKGNHILELSNANFNTFYRINWHETEPTEAIPIHNFLLKDLLLDTLDIDIEATAKEAFPEDIDIQNMPRLEIINYNSAAWDAEFKFLEEVIQVRYNLHLGTTTQLRSVYEVKPPLHDAHSTLGRLIEKHRLDFEARVILALAMSVYLRPQSLDFFFQRNERYDRTFTEAGGLKGKFHSGFLPTLETANFLLVGKDISKRIQLFEYYFGEESPFVKYDILRLVVKETTEPAGAGQLVMSNEYLAYLTTGKDFKPTHNDNFPAELLTTELEWKDLFLEQETLSEIQSIQTWLAYQDKIMYELSLKKHLKLGYRAIFYGSSGTGKTLTATLLGKNLGLDVYRVDLSRISSKYIGETSQNLARLFDMAENKKWILFFDEAEGLFGKRVTDIQRSTDAHYNQEVGYLLQRIENYNGLIILATNLLENIDTAFLRRFQSLVYFPVPSAVQQLALWQNIFASGLPLAKSVSLKTLSEKYIMTASNITNVLRYATIKTLQYKKPKISMQILIEGIEKELKKASLREKVGF